MKAYGLSRREAGDTDVGGCRYNARATAIYSLNSRAYRSLRNGKKVRLRRSDKRTARIFGLKEIKDQLHPSPSEILG